MAFTSWAYDAVGNATLRTDARSRLTTYTLDSLNRITGQLYIDETRVTNTFDAAEQQLTMQDVSGITNYSYDRQGMRTVMQKGTSLALTYAFDPGGNTLQYQNPLGGFMQWAYDQQNRVATVFDSDSERTTIAWDALDRLQRVTLGNGVTTSRT